MVNLPPPPPKRSLASHLVSAHTLQGSLTSSPRVGNVSFNEQGQGVLLSNREVVIFTPHQPSQSRSYLPPPPPTLPLILDDTSLSIPTLPLTHSLLPLHLTRTSILPFPWDGYRPPSSYEWEFDGPVAKRLLESELIEEYKASLQSDSTNSAIPGWTRGGGPTDLNNFNTNKLSTPLTREVVWSPSGMGYRDGNGGCVMAVLDERLNVTIRAAKEVVNGDWVVLGDLTRESYLLSAPSSSSLPPPPPRKKPKSTVKGKGKAQNPIEVDTPLTTPATSEFGDVQGKSGKKGKGKGKEVDRTGNGMEMGENADANRGGVRSGLQREMELQVMCMAWSSSPRFGKPFGLRPHASLLALGSRSGEIALWCMQELKQRPIGESGMKRLYLEQVAKSWITQMGWSEWEQVDDHTNTARLAFATPDGSVAALKVSRKIDPMTEVVELKVGQPVILIEEDGRPVTGMKWVHGVLIVTKVGIVHVVRDQGDSIESRKIVLKRRGTWAGCTAYSPCSGICSFPHNSTLIALSSGELHLIRNLSGEPYVDDATSTELMLVHRRALADANQSKSADDMTMRLQGFDGLYCDLVGGSFVFASVHEPLNMHDLTSARESARSYHVSIVDFAGLVKAPQELVDDEMTGVTVTGPPDYIAASLTSFLPSIYRAKLNLSNDPIAGLPFHPITPPASSEASSGATTISALRSTLQWELLQSPESKLVHAKAVWATWNAAAGVDVQLGQVGLDAPPSPEDRMARVLRSTILWLGRSMGSSQAAPLSTQDATLAQRIIKASHVYADLETDVDVAAALVQIQHPLEDLSEIAIDDRCLFCNEVLPLVGFDLERLTQSCSLGHVWSRCSLTWQLITTPTVRSCSVCHLKTLLPRVPAIDHDTAAPTADYRTQDILTAASRCAACGGSWRRLV